MTERTLGRLLGQNIIVHWGFSWGLFQWTSRFDYWKHLRSFNCWALMRKHLVLNILILILTSVFASNQLIMRVGLRFRVSSSVVCLEILNFVFTYIGVRWFWILTFPNIWIFLSGRCWFLSTYINLTHISDN